MFTNHKIAVITSIYGNYDNLKTHNIPGADQVDWFCFTDNKNISSNQWKIINTPYHLNDPDSETYKKYKNFYSNIDKNQKSNVYNMMCAKYYKMKAHHIDILQDYDYYVWIDGSIILRPDFIKNVLKLCDNYNLINFKHSERNNIKDEYKLSITMIKYKDQDLTTQYKTYIDSGFKDDVGLFENTISIRKNTSIINKIYDEWWIHNLKYSYQDQISYPYVLWKFNYKPDYIINENVFNNNNYSYVNRKLMQNH
jgi:hypothetical protein